MTLQDFARFFVRFNGLSFIFWGFYTLIDIPPYYRNYIIVREVDAAREIAAQDFWSLVLKVLLQLLIGVALLGRADHVINLLIYGRWAKRPSE